MTSKALAVAALTVLCAGVAEANAPRCAPHADMLALLARHYGEVPQAVGLINQNRVVEVLSSRQGTFTILVTQPNGMTCILAAGQDFEEVPDHLASLDPQA
jgi:hypothetical protein